ncbi:hypothetical protein D5086_025412 [Populus alba]|uniref:Uncharacterized protein n=1 Tax=Populus alba TaxID=43335 RepID=A0ACC4AZ29_POPAL
MTRRKKCLEGIVQRRLRQTIKVHKGAVNLDNPAKEAVQLGDPEFHGEWLVVARNRKSKSMSNKGDSVKENYSTKINNKLGLRMTSQMGFRGIMGLIVQALMGV